MDPNLQLHNLPTSLTPGGPGPFGAGTKGDSPVPANRVFRDSLSEYDNKVGAPTSQPALEPAHVSSRADGRMYDNFVSPIDRRTYDILLLAGIIVMLLWPWIFWGVAFHVKGIQMSDHFARAVVDHPHSTNFLVTLVGNLVRLVIAILFSLSIIRLAQEWLAVTGEVTVFHVSLLSAFRYQSWPWGLKDLKVVLGRNRWLLILLVGSCIDAFAFVPSGTTSLLGPVPFNKTVALTGTELDFSSTDSECVQFLDANPLSNNCDWQTHKGVPYTSCLGQNQLVDILESGRSNILSLLEDNSQSLTFSQLGNQNGLRFLGPLRGTLPMGPNGVPAFDTIRTSRISDPQARAAMFSYNYTLGLQGLDSNVTCIYDTKSPIKFGRLEEPTTLALQYNGTCDGQADVLNSNNVLTFVSVNAENGLGYWACKSPPDSQQEQSYYVYLRGRANYTNPIGNITCTISPIKPAVFPVTYQSQSDIFSLKEPTSIAPIVYPQLVEHALVALGGVVHESQNWEANVVAESVITFAVKSFELQPYGRTPDHLRLYGAMIQGMLEYITAYIRLIYSTVEEPPTSCIRTVKGTATYQVIGWFAKFVHIGFLMPMTLINLASLAIITTVLIMAKGQARDFDPTETRPLLAANVTEGQKHDEWEDEVFFRRSESPVNASHGLHDNLSRAVTGFAGNIFPSN